MPIDGVRVPADLPERLARLMASVPSLTRAGVGYAYNDPDAYIADRDRLAVDLTEIAAVMEILLSAPRTAKPKLLSYTLKHFVENMFTLWAGHYAGYCGNGAACAAAMLMDRQVLMISAPNILVDVPAAWLYEVERREREIAEERRSIDKVA